MTKTFRLICGLAIALQVLILSSIIASPNSAKFAKRKPLSFIENKGQIKDQNSLHRSDIDFSLSAGNGLNIFVGQGAIHYQFSKCNDNGRENPIAASPRAHISPLQYSMYRMDVELIGANKFAKAVTSQKQDYCENYFTDWSGEQGAKAHAFNRITYKDIYPNIDWVLYTQNGKLKHEFVVRAGGKVSDIRLKYNGAKSLKVNNAGGIDAITPMGTISEEAPKTFQKDGKQVSSSFRLQNDILTYEVGTYNGEIVIDPSLLWATYFGGSSIDQFEDMILDRMGNACITGRTFSASSIATSGAFQTTYLGGVDAIIVKFSSSGNVKWATYYGGAANDIGSGISTDAADNIYVTGQTQSTTGIASVGAYQTVLAGLDDAFIVKFSSDGFRLWGTYYGGSNADVGSAVVADGVGNVYISGSTASTAGIATTGTFQTIFGGDLADAFVVKFNTSGVRQWGTYFGSLGFEEGRNIALDGVGNVYLAANCTSLSPGLASSGAYQTSQGSAYDGVLVKFDNIGNRVWSTYYGGTDEDAIHDICSDAAGNIYFTGYTYSTGMASSSVYQTSLASTYDIIIGKFDASGNRQWATYYGGDAGEIAYGISIDAVGNIYIAATTASTTGITTIDAFQLIPSAFGDVCVAKFNNAGTSLLYGSYIGGPGSDEGRRVVFDDAGNLIMCGSTKSTSSIATAGAYQETHGGNWDGMLAKFNLCTPPVVAPVTGPMYVCPGNTITLADVTSGGSWSASDPSVATVSSGGVVTGISAGNVIISYTVVSGGCPGYAKAKIIVGNPIITTIAGTGTAGSGGDGGPATAANLNHPHGLAIDGTGNIYVDNNAGHTIRIINTSGIITTVAGTGTAGYVTDGVAATSTPINTPYEVATDEAGNLYIADALNHRVRKVSTSGIITTIAGIGTSGSTGDGGPATAAQLNTPSDIAFDASGNMYIAEVFGHRIRKINPAGIISTIAGTGTAGFTGDGVATAVRLNNPNYLVFAPNGNLIVTDNANHRIRSINTTTGTISTIAGIGTAGFLGDNGAATSARINFPAGVAFDDAGNMFIADFANERIRMVNTSGIISTYAGSGTAGYLGDNGPATAARFNRPVDVVFDAKGNMLIADENNAVVRKISPVAPVLPVTITGPSAICQGVPTLFANSTPGGSWTSSNTAVVSVGNTTGYATGVSAGTATLTYTINYTCGTYYVTTPITVNGFSGGTISGPTNVCVGGTITLTDATSGGTWSSLDPTIASVTSGGIVSGVSAGATAISYTITNGCGTIAATAWITVGNPIITTIAGGGAGGDGPATAALLQLPTHVFRDAASGDLYVPEFNGQKVRKVSASGIISTIAGIGITSSTGDGGPATSAATNGPAGVYRNAATGDIYIAEQNGHRVRKINSSGIISTIVGNGSATSLGDGGPATAATVNRPVGLTMDPAGNLYICEWGGGIIRKIDPSGIITRLAGGGPSVLDNVPATATSMNGPYHISLDGIGNLFVACQNNNIVRKIDLTTGIINTVAGTGTAGFTGDNGPATLARLTQCNGVYADRYSIYIGDASNNRVRKVDRTSGIITTIAGNGTATFAGDGGAPATASLRVPSSIALDNTGNIYIADAQNARIRKITMVPQPTVAAIVGSSPLCEGDPALFTNSVSGGVWSSSDPAIVTVGSSAGVVMGVAAGTAIISYAVTYPCGIMYSTFPVTINPFSAGEISGPDIVCVGNTITLSSTASGGIWSSSNPGVATISSGGVLTGIATGYSSISYTVTTGCGSASAQLLVAVGNPIIRTIAGDGTAGAAGDGTAATTAQISGPHGITTDGLGNTYICDYNNNRIRKVSSSGIITTIAGTGAAGYSGDGAAATAAQLRNPSSAAFDPFGNLLFTDYNNNVIRKIDISSGVITTIVGIGSPGFFGDGGLATAALINHPPALICDAIGNIYFSDASNNRIRKVNPAGIITTIAGSASSGFAGDEGPATLARLNAPYGLALDADGNLFIADQNNGRIRKVDAFGYISTVAGTGVVGSSPDGLAATATAINRPTGLAVDMAGNLLYSDRVNNCVRQINHATDIVTTLVNISITPGFAGDGGAPATAQLNNVPLIHLDQAGNLYVSDFNNNRVRKVKPEHIPISAITGLTTVCQGATISLGNTTLGGSWSSSNTSIATVGTSGVVTGVTGGLVDISYSITDQCGIMSVMKTVTVTALPSSPAPITGIATVCAGATTTLSTTTTGGVWSSITPAVATIGSSSGIVTGITGGTTIISYTVSNSCGSAAATTVVTVNAAAGVILGTPNVCVGQTTSLSGSPSGGTWTSGNTAVATVGTTGIVSGVAAGATNITYTTSGGCNGVLPVTVNPLPGPFSGTLTVCPGNTTTLTATGAGTWSSSNSLIASVGSTTGIVTGVAPGNAVITATSSSGCNATTIVTVNPVPSPITPSGAVDMCEGASVTLSDPTPGGTWSSGSVSIATVGSAGIVTGIAAGTATISYANSFGCSATKTVTVNITPSAISPSSTTVCPGATVTLTNSISGGIWLSSDPGTASVSVGIVTGIATGSATITYSIGTCMSTATVTVTVLPVAGTISGSPTICTATPVTFTNGTPGGIWSSSNTAVAVVGTSGIVTGLSGGTAVISYSVTNSCGTAVATYPVTVSATASAGTIVGLAAICAGTYTTLTNATPGGTWSVTNSNASITGTGILTGIIPGVDTVLYTVTNACGTAVARHRVTIGVYLTAGTISGPSSVCAGSTITLTDPVTGGTWSSSSSAATVAGGLVTGISAGTATISYTVTASCGSATATHLVNVIPLPDAGIVSGPTIMCAGISATYSTTGTSGVWGVTNATASITSGGFLTALTTGIDTILYTVTNACGADVSSTTVTIGPAISAGSITGPGFVCEGASITLFDAAPGGIWSASNSNATITSTGVVTGVSAGSVDISYTVTSACGTTSAISHLAVLPAPDAGVISGPTVVCTGATITLTDPVPGGTWTASNSNGTVAGGIVTGISTGTVDISYSVTSACGTARAVYPVTVGAAPVVGSISGPTSVCVGAVITLSDATPGGVWSADNTNAAISASGDVTGMSAGTDMMTYTVTTACGSAFTTSLITIDPLPDAGVISGPSDVCIGAAITLTDPAIGGVWSASNTNATVAAGVVTGVTSGLVDISYTVTNICGSASAVSTIIVNDAPDAGVIVGSLAVCTGSSVTLIDAAPGGVWSASNTNAAVSGGVVTGVSAGVVTISYTVTNPCGTAVASVEVTVNATSAITPITGASSVCRGSTISLSNATSGGVWTASNGNATVVSGVVTGVTVGTVIISYSATTACGTATATKTITISQPPVPGAIAGPSAVCAGHTIALSNGVLGGTWSSSNSSIAAVDGTGTVTGVSAGSVTISYLVSNSCGSRAAAKLITVLSAADCGRVVVKGIGHDDLRIYPNPTNGTFSLKGTLVNGIDEEISIEITNLLGQVLHTGKIAARSGIVDERITLSGAIANGMYMLNVRTASGTQVFSFVVEQ